MKRVDEVRQTRNARVEQVLRLEAERVIAGREALCDGVEKYLEARFKPATGARSLEVDAIKVNDPVL